eukprot:scaffold4521_cov76-Isochrysis_galbana.AAC.2
MGKGEERRRALEPLWSAAMRTTTPDGRARPTTKNHHNPAPNNARTRRQGLNPPPLDIHKLGPIQLTHTRPPSSTPACTQTHKAAPPPRLRSPPRTSRAAPHPVNIHGIEPEDAVASVTRRLLERERIAHVCQPPPQGEQRSRGAQRDRGRRTRAIHPLVHLHKRPVRETRRVAESKPGGGDDQMQAPAAATGALADFGRGRAGGGRGEGGGGGGGGGGGSSRSGPWGGRVIGNRRAEVECLHPNGVPLCAESGDRGRE